MPETAGIHLTPLRGVVESHAALCAADGGVVLVEFPSQVTDEQLERLEHTLVQHPRFAWIALVPEQWQQQERLCALITRAFYDFHHLPPQGERLATTIGHALGMLELRRHVDRHYSPNGEPGQLLGNSPELRQLKTQIARVAAYPGTVLIHGESGTGKELVARAIHQLSPRHDGPFEALNCAALPSSLIQAELFGHEKGAYTSAHRQNHGRFEVAHGGTLFLDEIGDMPPEQQVNLLRVLEQGCLRRIGGSREIPIDVRILSATHVDLEQAVQQGRFREDLYYRLNVVKLQLPPLRERFDDIELLAHHFLEHLRQPAQTGPRGFSKEAINAMHNHHWPGNVRELINRVQHALVMAEGPLILPADMNLEQRQTSRQRITLESARNEAEFHAITDALYRHHHVTAAARELGISRATLYRLLEKHHLAP
ncbi:MAG: sigma-54 dependent transcriptional regulator [Gammaproteobacteria bacterium]|nr:sigma-54 dependent transcriptional regulator [Gammaproteobacteria bacterium]